MDVIILHGVLLIVIQRARYSHIIAMSAFEVALSCVETLIVLTFSAI
jgi:hypothetical protein